MDSTLDLMLEAHRNELKRGCILVNRADEGTEPKMLFILDHQVRDGSQDRAGQQRVISRKMQFVLIDAAGNVTLGGQAPYLDYEPVSPDEAKLVHDLLEQTWLQQNMEGRALEHAVKHLVPDHFAEVRSRRERFVDTTLAAVHERLTKEINYWIHRYEKLKLDLAAGKQPRMQPENARRRAEDLTERLQQRKTELDAQRHVVSSTPLVVGGALIIPQGLLEQRQGKAVPQWATDASARALIEKLAMDAVMAAERKLGFEPEDVSAANHGWDVQSRDGKGEVRFIEVKGRVIGAPTITVTKNEILAGLNQPDRFILALVMVDGDKAEEPCYVRNPFNNEPDFTVTSINFDLAALLAKGAAPA